MLSSSESVSFLVRVPFWCACRLKDCSEGSARAGLARDCHRHPHAGGFPRWFGPDAKDAPAANSCGPWEARDIQAPRATDDAADPCEYGRPATASCGPWEAGGITCAADACGYGRRMFG